MAVARVPHARPWNKLADAILTDMATPEEGRCRTDHAEIVQRLNHRDMVSTACSENRGGNLLKCIMKMNDLRPACLQEPRESQEGFTRPDRSQGNFPFITLLSNGSR
jgi:hypothetical protein